MGISGLLLVCVMYCIIFTAGFTSSSVTSKVPEHFSTAGSRRVLSVSCEFKRNLCHFRVYGSNIVNKQAFPNDNTDMLHVMSVASTYIRNVSGFAFLALR